MPASGSPPSCGMLSSRCPAGCGLSPSRNRLDDRCLLVARRVARHEVGDTAKLVLAEHAGLRERQLVDGIVGYARPIDEFVDHIPVGPKRQNAANDAHREPVVAWQRRQLRNPVEVAFRDRPIPRDESPCRRVVPRITAPGSVRDANSSLGAHRLTLIEEAGVDDFHGSPIPVDVLSSIADGVLREPTDWEADCG